MPSDAFFENAGPYKIKDLVLEFGGSFDGDEDLIIKDVATLQAATSGDISFFSNTRYIAELNATKASVCIIDSDNSNKTPESVAAWTVQNPYHVWACVLEKFYPQSRHRSYIAESAIISNNVKIGKNVYIGHGVFIGEGAVVCDECCIEENSYIGKGVFIGKGTRINNNASITHAVIGEGCIIHTGARIGQDGFGFAQSNSGITKVPQLGMVVIGNCVEIGANTCIDRGAIEDTYIGDYTKIDNLVQIGHNVSIGKYCIIVSQTGIAGSTTIGDGCVFGGQSGVSGHIKIGKKVTLAARGGIIRDVEDGQVLGGVPAVPIRQWHKQTAVLKKLSN